MVPEEDFEEKIKSVKKPALTDIKSPAELKVAILRARSSATLGFWFVIVPSFFLACVAMKYYFHINLGVFNTFDDMVADLDRAASTRWITPLLFVGLPLASIIINLLAIAHFAYHPETQVMVVTVKIRWFNLVILFISITLVGIFLLYGIMENANPH